MPFNFSVIYYEGEKIFFSAHIINFSYFPFSFHAEKYKHTALYWYVPEPWLSLGSNV